MSRHFAINDADLYRDLAQRRRNRGVGGTVRVFATSRAMEAARGGNVGPGTWDHCLWDARRRWEIARNDAHEDFLRIAFPERYDGFDTL